MTESHRIERWGHGHHRGHAATYEKIGKDDHLGADPYDPHDYLLVGGAYPYLHAGKYRHFGLFAAYDAGPNARGEPGGRAKNPPKTRADSRDIVCLLAPHAPSMTAGTDFDEARRFAHPYGRIDHRFCARVTFGEDVTGVCTVLAMGRYHRGVRENGATVKSLP
jgi:hypothetical protein